MRTRWRDGENRLWRRRGVWRWWCLSSKHFGPVPVPFHRYIGLQDITISFTTSHVWSWFVITSHFTAPRYMINSNLHILSYVQTLLSFWTDYKECTINGDPEYRTFDDRKHTFRGDRSYVLAQTISQSRTLPGFYIEGINTPDRDDGDHSEDDEERSSEEHHHSHSKRDEDSDEDDEDDEDDSKENNRKHYRLREMKIRVYNHTVEFKRNGALVVSALASSWNGLTSALTRTDHHITSLIFLVNVCSVGYVALFRYYFRSSLLLLLFVVQDIQIIYSTSNREDLHSRSLWWKESVYRYTHQWVEEWVCWGVSAIPSLALQPLLAERVTNGAACDLNSWLECRHQHQVHNLPNTADARAFISGLQAQSLFIFSDCDSIDIYSNKNHLSSSRMPL